jgi:hypothetical protein
MFTALILNGLRRLSPDTDVRSSPANNARGREYRILCRRVTLLQAGRKCKSQVVDCKASMPRFRGDRRSLPPIFPECDVRRDSTICPVFNWFRRRSAVAP